MAWRESLGDEAGDAVAGLHKQMERAAEGWVAGAILLPNGHLKTWNQGVGNAGIS